MTGSSDDPEKQARAAVERASFTFVREHVGAAGFAQREALEHLINAGREQIEFTQSLRQVLATTLAELHALPLVQLHEAADPHVAALETIVQSSRTQLETADHLRHAVQEALLEVQGTPMEDISVHVLNDVGEVVHRQAADLEALITLALQEVTTVKHITTLERTSAKAHAHLLDTDRGRSEQDLLRLTQVRHDALKRIRMLEEGGETHAAQKAELVRETEASREHIVSLEAGEARDEQEIARLERQVEASRARTTELEAVAMKTQEKIARLRAQVTGLHRREREGEHEADPRPRGDQHNS